MERAVGVQVLFALFALGGAALTMAAVGGWGGRRVAGLAVAQEGRRV